MRIIVTPDSYKECMSSREVAASLADAARRLRPDAEVVEMPLADGGEGTVDILTAALRGTIHEAVVSDALGRPVTARYGVVGAWGAPAVPPSGLPEAADGIQAVFPAAGASPGGADGFPAVFPAAGASPGGADGFPAVFPAAGASPRAADGFSAVFPAAGASPGGAADGFRADFPAAGASPRAADGFPAVFPAAGASPGAADGFPADFPAAGGRGGAGAGGALAIIEAAQACGLERLAAGERDPLAATSRGVGELIMAAYGDGCRRFIVGLGGSATCDGGEGMLSVPGVKEALRDAEFEILCDVDAPFAGPNGAARMYAPQKGASPEAVAILEQRMQERAAAILRETGRDIAAVPGAGAAGGLGGAFLAYANAPLSPGVDRILDLVGFDSAVLAPAPKGAAPEGTADHCAPGGKEQGCAGQGAQGGKEQGCAGQGENHSASGYPDDDLVIVITGEGRSDRQTLQGKLPLGVLRRVQALASRLAAASPSNACDVPGAPGGSPESAGNGAFDGARSDAPTAGAAFARTLADAPASPQLKTVLISGTIEPEAHDALLKAGFSALVSATPPGTPPFKALSPYFTKKRLRLCLDIALHKIACKV